ncbi:MAG: methyltransferase domain-containing protein [Nitrososphaerota archaeon]|nr:methyltransferase domain-containing protein [Nitrososphaerota archaeon]MDG7024192.1 methyltransferase domain-containing protein [Nitrososphaerota archaeon]
MSRDQYLASEDSALLRNALEGRSGERCLEIGAGNGGNLVPLAGRFQVVVGTDLVRPSMTDWKGAGADFVLADGASCLREEAFDLVAFNPPYVRAPIEDKAVDGGASLEVPKKFLLEALRAVKKGGKIVFVLNDEAEPEDFRRVARAKGFALRPLATKRLFFEELTAYLASPVETPLS